MKIKELTDDFILMDNDITITYYHDQDCCEHVYADFESLKDQNILNEEFEEIKIEMIEDFGFKLNGYPVPCYNSQNGYYSSNLDLIIDYGKGKKEIYNLSNYDDKRCIIDQID